MPELTTFGAVQPPIWRPLRRTLLAASGGEILPLALPTGMTLDGMSMNGEGFRWGLYRFRVVNGSPTGASISLRPVFWNDASSRFTFDNGVLTQVFSQTAPNYNIPGMFRFNLYGRRFSVIVTSNASTLTVDIDAAVFGGPNIYGLYD